jgi:predicted dehydrogenase
MYVPAIGGIPELQLVSVCDTDIDKLRPQEMIGGIQTLHTDVDEFLEGGQDLDFVIVTTPVFTHYEIGKKVILAGKNVLIEKPLSLYYEQSAELEALAKEYGVKVCVGQTWRYREPILRAIQAMEDGLLGEVYQTKIVHHIGSLLHVSLPPWAWEERKYRTLLYEHAIHLLDFQVLFGGPVRSVGDVRFTKEPELGVTSKISALAEHTSGAISFIDIQGFSSTKFTTLEIFGTASDISIKFFPHSYRIYCGRLNPLDELLTEGKRLVDFVSGRLKDKLIKNRVPAKAQPHLLLLKDFIRSIESGTTPSPVSIEDVMLTMHFLDLLGEQVYR